MMDEMDGIYSMLEVGRKKLVRIPQWKKPFGRHRYWCEDNVKSDPEK